MKRAEILKQLIDKTGLNTKAFAEKAGLPYTTLRSMLMRGVGGASVVNVIKVCKALGITVEQLEEMASTDNYDIKTIAAHHDGEDWTEEELEAIEKFKKFVRSERNKG
ncbi:helix-turn-helix transcriptional regulator [Paenibacillus hemerocallicola]|uniref:Helix-turn-helix transcriptional regulator n=1 Tax=Paenibacillus hemerocallicola TaxID=1172614 RepID=A0A5C4THX5_9BACL|nr:helix-turn-helix transcriptional regulator [Paenibacillus hemerocallicola]TNJ68187.1 helix-turn-helix transcriptional regulator [Paenibacillus hemerocallicola]